MCTTGWLGAITIGLAALGSHGIGGSFPCMTRKGENENRLKSRKKKYVENYLVFGHFWQNKPPHNTFHSVFPKLGHFGLGQLANTEHIHFLTACHRVSRSHTSQHPFGATRALSWALTRWVKTWHMENEAQLGRCRVDAVLIGQNVVSIHPSIHPSIHACIYILGPPTSPPTCTLIHQSE